MKIEQNLTLIVELAGKAQKVISFVCHKTEEFDGDMAVQTDPN